MKPWHGVLCDLLSGGTPVVSVTVIDVQGSVPREPGARMLVHQGGFEDTIGGGQLEFETLATARDMLGGAQAAALRQFSLGPELGQCCGGTARLLFELFAPTDEAWAQNLNAAAGAPCRAAYVAVFGEDGIYRRDVVTADASVPDGSEELQSLIAEVLSGTSRFAVALGESDCALVDYLGDERQPVWLFGAGHVGRAVVRALMPLPFALTWIDSRDDAFEGDIPDGVDVLQSAMPQYAVEDAPPDTFFLVMTHSHDLDQAVCEAVLRRGDGAYLGLIGSATKKARFLSRLSAKGLGDETLARLICPIGLDTISGKEPAVIAASVAADLLTRLSRPVAETSERKSQGARRHV